MSWLDRKIRKEAYMIQIAGLPYRYYVGAVPDAENVRGSEDFQYIDKRGITDVSTIGSSISPVKPLAEFDNVTIKLGKQLGKRLGISDPVIVFGKRSRDSLDNWAQVTETVNLTDPPFAIKIDRSMAGVDFTGLNRIWHIGQESFLLDPVTPFQGESPSPESPNPYRLNVVARGALGGALNGFLRTKRRIHTASDELVRYPIIGQQWPTEWRGRPLWIYLAPLDRAGRRFNNQGQPNDDYVEIFGGFIDTTPRSSGEVEYQIQIAQNLSKLKDSFKIAGAESRLKTGEHYFHGRTLNGVLKPFANIIEHTQWMQKESLIGETYITEGFLGNDDLYTDQAKRFRDLTSLALPINHPRGAYITVDEVDAVEGVIYTINGYSAQFEGNDGPPEEFINVAPDIVARIPSKRNIRLIPSSNSISTFRYRGELKRAEYTEVLDEEPLSTVPWFQPTVMQYYFNSDIGNNGDYSGTQTVSGAWFNVSLEPDTLTIRPSVVPSYYENGINPDALPFFSWVFPPPGTLEEPARVNTGDTYIEGAGFVRDGEDIVRLQPETWGSKLWYPFFVIPKQGMHGSKHNPRVYVPSDGEDVDMLVATAFYQQGERYILIDREMQIQQGDRIECTWEEPFLSTAYRDSGATVVKRRRSQIIVVQDFQPIALSGGGVGYLIEVEGPGRTYSMGTWPEYESENGRKVVFEPCKFRIVGENNQNLTPNELLIYLLTSLQTANFSPTEEVNVDSINGLIFPRILAGPVWSVPSYTEPVAVSKLVEALLFVAKAGLVAETDLRDGKFKIKAVPLNQASLSLSELRITENDFAVNSTVNSEMSDEFLNSFVFSVRFTDEGKPIEAFNYTFNDQTTQEAFSNEVRAKAIELHGLSPDIDRTVLLGALSGIGSELAYSYGRPRIVWRGQLGTYKGLLGLLGKSSIVTSNNLEDYEGVGVNLQPGRITKQKLDIYGEGIYVEITHYGTLVAGYNASILAHVNDRSVEGKEIYAIKIPAEWINENTQPFSVLNGFQDDVTYFPTDTLCKVQLLYDPSRAVANARIGQILFEDGDYYIELSTFPAADPEADFAGYGDPFRQAKVILYPREVANASSIHLPYAFIANSSGFVTGDNSSQYT